MRCPDGGEWDLLSMSLVNDPRADALRVHAQTCGACGEAQREANRAHGELLQLYAGERGRPRSRSELLAKLPAAPQAARRRRPAIGASLMKSITRPRVGAFGVAAAVLIAAGAFFYSERPSVAWAEVARRIERVKTAVTTMHVIDPQQDDAVVTNRKFYMSEDNGLRTDTFTDDGQVYMQEFALPARDEWVTICHTTAQFGPGYFERRRMTRQDRERIADSTPANWAATLLGLRSLEHARELEPAEVAGRPTAVFQVRNLTIWVDVRTKLPVRMVADGAFRAVFESIAWDQPLAAEVFEPHIPEGLEEKTPPEPSTPAWFERVLREMRLQYAIQYDTRLTTTMNGAAFGPEIKGRRYFSNTLGVRTEWYQDGQLSSVEIYNRAENRWAWIGHATRTYDSATFRPGEETKGGWNLTPDQWLEGFARLAKDPSFTALETKEIGGRRVLGYEFRTAMPRETGGGERIDRYWIDETGLVPARCEHDVPVAYGRRSLLTEENFRWNPALEAGMFAIDVPEGYRSIRDEPADER